MFNSVSVNKEVYFLHYRTNFLNVVVTEIRDVWTTNYAGGVSGNDSIG